MYRVYIDGYEVTEQPITLTPEEIRKYNNTGIVTKKEEKKA